MSPRLPQDWGGAFDADGWCNCVRHVPSPNRDARPEDASVELLVIHNISLPPGVFTGPAVQRLFTNQLLDEVHPYLRQISALRVSAHFFVRRDGEIIQFVPCAQRAWHAGLSQWRGRDRCNDFSIGIEVEGTDTLPYAEVQYAKLTELVLALAQRHPIRAVVGHEHIAPGRKTDPGPAFDWPRLKAQCALNGVEFAAASQAQDGSDKDASNSA